MKSIYTDNKRLALWIIEKSGLDWRYNKFGFMRINPGIHEIKLLKIHNRLS